MYTSLKFSNAGEVKVIWLEVPSLKIADSPKLTASILYPLSKTVKLVTIWSGLLAAFVAHSKVPSGL